MAADSIYFNPAGLDGFEFIEFCSPSALTLAAHFEQLGFTAIARHRTKNVTLYRQGNINFILNDHPNSFAAEFAKKHGPAACAMAFRVKDAKVAMQRALARGARVVETPVNKGELALPAIYGIGESLIYFVDQYQETTIYDLDFIPNEGVDQHPSGVGLLHIDHLTHNLLQGHMETWADFYYHLFCFRDIRYFDIHGIYTGLISRALASPCNKIKIPLNEPTDPESQIAEFINEFKGEGIQHIALTTDNIYKTVELLREKNITFMDVPESYYDMVEARLPSHGEDLQRLRKNYILIDGQTLSGEKQLLLQIFTKTMLGPVFFEIIQRKGDEGFGEGNFKALFESIECDQIRRGVIKKSDEK